MHSRGVLFPCCSLIITIEDQFPKSEFESIQSKGFIKSLHEVLLNNFSFKNIKKSQWMSLFFKKT